MGVAEAKESPTTAVGLSAARAGGGKASLSCVWCVKQVNPIPQGRQNKALAVPLIPCLCIVHLLALNESRAVVPRVLYAVRPHRRHWLVPLMVGSVAESLVLSCFVHKTKSNRNDKSTALPLARSIVPCKFSGREYRIGHSVALRVCNPSFLYM